MKKLILCAALALMGAGCVWAQNERSAEERSKMREQMIQNTAERLAKDFNLKNDAKNQFMETFVAFQTEMIGDMQFMDRNRDEAEADGKKKELTDEEATAKILENFSRQEKQIEMMTRRMVVQKKYYEELSKILTPQQLVKIFAQRPQQRGGRDQQGQQGQRMRGPGGFGGPGGGRGGFGGPGGFGGGF